MPPSTSTNFLAITVVSTLCISGSSPPPSDYLTLVQRQAALRHATGNDSGTRLYQEDAAIWPLDILKAMRPFEAMPSSLPFHLNDKRTGYVVFLHGFGVGGAPMKKRMNDKKASFLYLDRLAKAGVEVIFPTAPLGKPPACFGAGPDVPVWFDPANSTNPLTTHLPEPTSSVDSTYEDIIEPLLKDLRDKVGMEKVLVGGESQGAEMALHMLRLAPKLGGVFSLSGFLRHGSEDWTSLKSSSTTPEVWMAHGTADVTVPFEAGELTKNRLKRSGVHVTWVKKEDGTHSLTRQPDVMQSLTNWTLHLLNVPESEISDLLKPTSTELHAHLQ